MKDKEKIAWHKMAWVILVYNFGMAALIGNMNHDSASKAITVATWVAAIAFGLYFIILFLRLAYLAGQRARDDG